jgi:hypothetical protein
MHMESGHSAYIWVTALKNGQGRKKWGKDEEVGRFMFW